MKTPEIIDYLIETGGDAQGFPKFAPDKPVHASWQDNGIVVTQLTAPGGITAPPTEWSVDDFARHFDDFEWAGCPLEHFDGGEGTHWNEVG